MKRLGACLALAVILVLAASPTVRADHVFIAFMDGGQEVPPNESAASGIGLFVLNDDLTELNWAIYYVGLEGGNTTGAHFHQGPFGMSAGVVRGYSVADFTSPDGYVVNAWTAKDPQQALTETRVNALFEGNIYFNIHSQTWPGGEIRGQVFHFFSY